MPELRDPVPADLADLLRAAAREHRAEERGTEHPAAVHPAAVHAGRPGGARTRFVSPRPGRAGRARQPAALDHAVRCDVVGRLLDGLDEHGLDEHGLDEHGLEGAGPAPLLWLTRPAAQEEPDEDRAWLAAALTASAERGLDPWWVVVTPEGWRDPRSGAAGGR